VVGAYQRDVGTAGSALQALDAKVLANGAACASRSDIPKFWLRTAIGAEAMQTAMAASLYGSLKLDRRTLDAAWAAAPPEAIACARGAAAKTFHLPPPPCSDPKAALWFLQRLGIRAEQGHQTDASHALTYFAAKAHAEYADKLIAMLQRGAGRPG
jgi:hypothetical protein